MLRSCGSLSKFTKSTSEILDLWTEWLSAFTNKSELFLKDSLLPSMLSLIYKGWMLSKSTTCTKVKETTYVIKQPFNKIIGIEFKQLPHQLCNTPGYKYSLIVLDSPGHIGQVRTPTLCGYISEQWRILLSCAEMKLKLGLFLRNEIQLLCISAWSDHFIPETCIYIYKYNHNNYTSVDRTCQEKYFLELLSLMQFISLADSP